MPRLGPNVQNMCKLRRLGSVKKKMPKDAFRKKVVLHHKRAFNPIYITAAGGGEMEAVVARTVVGTNTTAHGSRPAYTCVGCTKGHT